MTKPNDEGLDAHCTEPPRVPVPEPKRDSKAPAARERRRTGRVRLEFDTAVPVLVRWEGTVQWGVARNISEGGMLLELRTPPNIGAQVEVRLAGIKGSIDAPDAAVLHGEVRHHLAWNFRGREGRASVSGVGIRFTDARAWTPRSTFDD